jgi:NADH oxidase (H2O2-forming)
VPRTVLVIGGGPAGSGAARGAKDADTAAAVTVLAPGGAAPDDPADERQRTARESLIASGVEFRGATQIAIDLDRRIVRADGAELRFDALVITDSNPDPATALPGSDLPGVLAEVPADSTGPEPPADGAGPRAVVVGATPRGLAAAVRLAAAGVDTTLVDPEPEPLADLVDPDVLAPVLEQLAAAGVRLRPATTVTGFLGTDGRLSAVSTSAGELPAELAVVATTPSGDPVDVPGIERGPTGRIAVDDRQRTSITGVYAAGPASEPVPGALRTASHEFAQGRAAGATAAGGDRRYHAAHVPWSASAGAAVLGGAGYGETAAAALGLRYVLGRAEGISRARYYPGVQKVLVKLLAEPGTLRLIGAQLRGAGEGVTERATFLAQAVRLGLTLHDLSTMENVYSPAIGALNEPIVVAATNGLADLAAAQQT